MADSLYTKDTFLSLLSSNNSCCGRVDIILPDYKGDSGKKDIVSGFLDDEFTLTLGNAWGSVLPDAQVANEIGQILGYQNLITWVQSSAASWKATQPLEFNMNVYLLTLTRNQEPITEEAKKIMRMMALYVDKNDIFTAKIHGGYRVNYATSNDRLEFWSKAKGSRIQKGDIKDDDEAYRKQISSIFTEMSGENEGTITIRINDTMNISNLLISNASFSHSSSYIDSNTPLYIKMDLSFRSSRALITSDVDKLYK